jgi:hypothetical protein
MKKYSWLALVFVLCLISCAEKDTGFYDKVLNDYGKTSYYIALNIRSAQYKGKAIIQNNDLYNFINGSTPLDKSSYVTKLKNILLHGKELNIDGHDLLKWKFLKVNEMNSVYLNAGKGLNAFISTYFDGSLFKPGISPEETNAVINQLFYWKVPVKIDGASGELLINE